jgi:hypothetical protein
MSMDLKARLICVPFRVYVTYFQQSMRPQMTTHL